MRCSVPFCKSTPDNGLSTGGKVSFHSFPSEVHLRAAWLKALGKQDGRLPDSAVVCSQHFLQDDIYETESGSRQVVTGAVPATVQVCMLCLDTDSKLVPVHKHRLKEAYEELTGQPMSDLGNLQQTLCVQCAQRLMSFSRFRDKSLRARGLMMDLVQKHEIVTRKHIKMINRTKLQLHSNLVLTTLGPDPCDLHIVALDSQGTHGVPMKTEACDDPAPADEDLELVHEYGSSANGPVKRESVLYQCTFCPEEFVEEGVYTLHMCMHLQNSAGDADFAAPQASEPLTGVSSARRALAPENERSVGRGARGARRSSPDATPLHSSEEAFTIKTEIKEEAHTNGSFLCGLLKDCYVELYDIYGNYNKDGPVGATGSAKRARTRKFTNDTADKTEICDTYKVKQENICSSELEEMRPKKLKGRPKIKKLKKQYRCEICADVCANTFSLSKHMRVHTGEKSHMCTVCGKKYWQRCHLSRHMTTHTGENHYECNLCEKKFTSNSSISVHMRTHTGEKPFICDVCGHKFAQHCNLVKHRRTHTGDKPYQCKHCVYRCSTSCSLTKHMKTHTGEKPFTCAICGKSVPHKSDLLVHIRKHHPGC